MKRGAGTDFKGKETLSHSPHFPLSTSPREASSSRGFSGSENMSPYSGRVWGGIQAR